VRWWYHFDNPQNSPAALVAKFEQENPGIKIQAEAIP
jgi:multiple sugar transport system substrate-binding protein